MRYASVATVLTVLSIWSACSSGNKIAPGVCQQQGCPSGSVCLNGACVQISTTPDGVDAAETETTAPPKDTGDETPDDVSLDLTTADTAGDLADGEADLADGEADLDADDAVDSQDLSETVALLGDGAICQSAAECQSTVCKLVRAKVVKVCVPSDAHCAYDDGGILFTTTAICTSTRSIANCVDGAWRKPLECPVVAPSCNENSCVFCRPAAYFCTGMSQVAQCNTTGDNVAATHQCPYITAETQKCNPNITGSLQDKCADTCTPGDLGGCSGSGYAVCNDQGAWEIKDCGDGKVCTGESVCVPLPYSPVYENKLATPWITSTEVARFTHNSTLQLLVGISATNFPSGDNHDVAILPWSPMTQTPGALTFLTDPEAIQRVGIQQYFDIDGVGDTGSNSVFSVWADRNETADAALLTRWWNSNGTPDSIVSINKVADMQYQPRAVFLSPKSAVVVWSEWLYQKAEAIRFALVPAPAFEYSSVIKDFTKDTSPLPWTLGWRFVAAARHGKNGFIAAWHRSKIHVRCYDAPNYTGSEILDIEDGSSDPVVAGNFDMPAVVVWQSGSVARFALINPACQTAAAPATVSPLTVVGSALAAAMWSDGSFVIVYLVGGESAFDNGLYAQRYTAKAAPVGEAIRLNQPGGYASAISVNAWGTDTFAVFWSVDNRIVGRLIAP